MDEKSEIGLRGLMARTTKEEIVEVIVLLTTVSPETQDVAIEKSKGMSVAAILLLVTIMVEMMANATGTRRELGRGDVK